MDTRMSVFTKIAVVACSIAAASLAACNVYAPEDVADEPAANDHRAEPIAPAGDILHLLNSNSGAGGDPDSPTAAWGLDES